MMQSTYFRTKTDAYFTILLFLILFALSAGPLYAQFEKPEIRKVSGDEWGEFERRFADIKWTGQGFNENIEGFDRLETHEIRARLQAEYGDPTKKLDDLITRSDFRLAEAIQFEYWFVVNDSIPMMVLDVDGPFRRGLVYGAASRYVDLMPEIKRTFTRELLEEEPADYEDYFYSPEREQWFLVRNEDGEYTTEEIDAPNGWSIN